MVNIMTIWKKKYVYKYAPNSVRYEVDDDVSRYAIYIRDNLYEFCPLQATKEEAEMRLHDIMEEMGIEWDTNPILRPLN